MGSVIESDGNTFPALRYSDIELSRVLTLERQSEDRLTLAPRSDTGFSLPPVDGGKEAYLCLVGCFFLEALVWGFPFSFGVFQEYYSSTEPFASEPSGIAAIGTTAAGIMYMGSLLVFPLMQRYPQYRRHCNIFGLPIMVAAMLLSSFANTVTLLILTQGLLYGIGGCLCYTPAILFLEEWFVRRKGLAFGVMWAGTGCAGVTVPFFMQSALNLWGYKTALRIWAVVLMVLAGPFIPFLKPRIPVQADTQRAGRRIDLRFLGSFMFWIPQLANIVQGLGYFIPSLYLPQYVTNIGLQPIVGTIALALFNGASVLGTILAGLMIDRLHHSTVTAMITLPSVISVFVFWGLGVNIPAIILFSLFYGLSAGGFSTTWTGNIKEIRENIGGDAGVIFGFLAAGRGIGAITSGPLSAAILEQASSFKGHAGWAYGTEYGSLIIFTGCTASAGVISLLARQIGWL